MTRAPRVRVSATFSAACRHGAGEEQAVAVLPLPVALSLYRGVLAMRNLATGWPDGVNRGLPARSAAVLIARTFAAYAAYADGDWETCDRRMAQGWRA